MKHFTVAVAVSFALSGARASAGTISAFEIVNASLGATGGIFNAGPDAPGNYFGTFSLDTSLIPTQGSGIPLSSVDVWTTPSGSFSGAHYTSGVLLVISTFLVPSTSSLRLDRDVISFGNETTDLSLLFVELHGTFVGGQIDIAEEGFGRSASLIRSDFSGQALAVDPALATPEPATWGFFLLGAAAIALARTLRHRSVGPMKQSLWLSIATVASALAQNMAPELPGAVAAAIYKIEPAGSGFIASNPAQDLTVRFNGGSTDFIHRTGRFTLSLDGEAAISRASARQNRVEFAHGGVTEWFVNGAAGVEQGFKVASKRSGGPLELTLEVTGDYAPAMEGGDVVLRRDGKTLLRYAGLRGWDAKGRALVSP